MLRVAVETEPSGGRQCALLLQGTPVRNLAHAIVAAQEQRLEVEGLPRHFLDVVRGLEGRARCLLFERKAKRSRAGRQLSRWLAQQLSALAQISACRLPRVAVLQEVQGRGTENAGPAFRGVRSLVLEALEDVRQQLVGTLQARFAACLFRVEKQRHLQA